MQDSWTATRVTRNSRITLTRRANANVSSMSCSPPCLSKIARSSRCDSSQASACKNRPYQALTLSAAKMRLDRAVDQLRALVHNTDFEF